MKKKKLSLFLARCAVLTLILFALVPVFAIPFACATEMPAEEVFSVLEKADPEQDSSFQGAISAELESATHLMPQLTAGQKKTARILIWSVTGVLLIAIAIITLKLDNPVLVQRSVKLKPADESGRAAQDGENNDEKRDGT